MIYLSQGTASRLGIKKIRMDVALTTAYIFFGEHCLMDCAFCPQARGSRAATGSGTKGNKEGSKHLGRVEWQQIRGDDLLDGLQRAPAGRLKRICIQGVKSAAANREMLHFIDQVKAVSNLPICVSTWLEKREEVARFFQAGVERVSIALDIVSKQAYARYKKGSLQQRCELLLACAESWPGRMGTHIIVGLGETEEQTVSLLDKLLGAGIGVALFAFTPLKGTALAGHPPPPLQSYRRIQAAHFLMRKELISLSRMDFHNGRLISFGLTNDQLQVYLEGGEAFQTSGCPDCNRPYYNERVGGDLYNYPRPLNGEEARAAIRCVSTTAEEGEEIASDGKMAGYL